MGLHRFYLRGFGDLWGWLLPVPTALGLYGIERGMQFGQDDQMSWWLMPLLGFNIAANGLNAIVYGLMSQEKWNRLYNPGAPDASAGRTTWLTIGGVAVALLVGTTILMSSIVFSFQRYFEYQIQEAMKISQ